jgi:hypothetical protein
LPVLDRPHVREWNGHGLQCKIRISSSCLYVGLTSLTAVQDNHFQRQNYNRQQNRVMLADIFLIIIIRGKSSVVRQHRSRAVASYMFLNKYGDESQLPN